MNRLRIDMVHMVGVGIVGSLVHVIIRKLVLIDHHIINRYHLLRIELLIHHIHIGIH